MIRLLIEGYIVVISIPACPKISFRPNLLQRLPIIFTILHFHHLLYLFLHLFMMNVMQSQMNILLLFVLLFPTWTPLFNHIPLSQRFLLLVNNPSTFLVNCRLISQLLLFHHILLFFPISLFFLFGFLELKLIFKELIEVSFLLFWIGLGLEGTFRHLLGLEEVLEDFGFLMFVF